MLYSKSSLVLDFKILCIWMVPYSICRLKYPLSLCAKRFLMIIEGIRDSAKFSLLLKMLLQDAKLVAKITKVASSK